MKATKMRNKQFYRASLTTLSKNTAAHLSKELQKKYGKRSVRITKGDNVKIVRGEYKGVDGKVKKVSVVKSSVSIEGVMIEKSKGEKIDIYTRASNVIVTGLNNDDKWRIHKLEGKKPKSIPKESKVKQKKVIIDEKDISEKIDAKPSTETEQILLESEKMKETKTISKTTKPKKEKSENVKKKITKKSTKKKSEK